MLSNRLLVKVSIIYAMIFSVHIGFTQEVESIGDGMSLQGAIYDIVPDNTMDRVYFVGEFTAIDGVRMNNVGYRQADNWHAISDSSTIEGRIYCAEYYNNELYIAGNFTIQKEEKIYNLAVLRNGVWQDLGVDRMAGSIRSMQWYQGELFVSGDFRALSGVRHYGVVKYVNGVWKDAGLVSHLNAKDFFIANDRLYAYGSAFAGNNQSDSKSLVYFLNNEWHYAPPLSDNPLSNAKYYNGNIYVASRNKIYRLDSDENSWLYIGNTGTINAESFFYVHNDDLYIANDECSMYKLENGQIISIDFPLKLLCDRDKIYSILSRGNELLVGGFFHNSEHKAASLVSIDDETVNSIGLVSSKIQHIDAWYYTIGSSVATYNGKYVIGGRFIFADNIYSPNIVYWDGNGFTAFDVSISARIKQLVTFEDELYLVPHTSDSFSEEHLQGYNLIKFDGSSWVGVNTPSVFEGIKVINNKLFLLREQTSKSTNGGPNYLEDGQWKKLSLYIYDGQIPWFYYGHIDKYKEGYIKVVESFPEGNRIAYLPSDSSE